MLNYAVKKTDWFSSKYNITFELKIVFCLTQMTIIGYEISIEISGSTVVLCITVIVSHESTITAYHNTAKKRVIFKAYIKKDKKKPPKSIYN